MGERYVSYLRVSTARQGASGLGLEAQREAVRRYVEGRAGRPDGTRDGFVVGPPPAHFPKENLTLAEFIEVESGKHADRPKLHEALDLAEMTGATLVVAKLDRLSRNVAFLATLMDRKDVEFVAVDFPEANRLTLHILAAMAEHERRMISERTKSALSTVKARLAAGEPYVSRASGKVVTRLGNPNGADALRRASRASGGPGVRRRKADEYAAKVRKRMCCIPGAETMTLAALAAELTARGIRAPGGAVWHPTAVARVLARTPLTPAVPSSTHSAP